MEASYVFLYVVFNVWRSHQLTSIVLDLAAMLFILETPKVFCALKHFTHATIGTVVSS